jgi:hypothetical protein
LSTRGNKHIFFSQAYLLSRNIEYIKYCPTYYSICMHYIFYSDPEAWVRFPALPEKKVVGLERGPLSLASTTEELLDRKVAAPV